MTPPYRDLNFCLEVKSTNNDLAINGNLFRLTQSSQENKRRVNKAHNNVSSKDNLEYEYEYECGMIV